MKSLLVIVTVTVILALISCEQRPPDSQIEPKTSETNQNKISSSFSAYIKKGFTRAELLLAPAWKNLYAETRAFPGHLVGITIESYDVKKTDSLITPYTGEAVIQITQYINGIFPDAGTIDEYNKRLLAILSGWKRTVLLGAVRPQPPHRSPRRRSGGTCFGPPMADGESGKMPHHRANSYPLWMQILFFLRRWGWAAGGRSSTVRWTLLAGSCACGWILSRAPSLPARNVGIFARFMTRWKRSGVTSTSGSIAQSLWPACRVRCVRSTECAKRRFLGPVLAAGSP